LDEEKHQLLERINETQQSYRKALNDLKAQEQHREVNYGREKKVHSNTLRSLQERESLLETDKEEMISAVMLAQEELQEKTAQLKREEAARQWVEADRDGVQVQLGQCKARLETELNERQQHHENARRRIEQLQSENESLRVSTGQMEVLRKAEEGKIETLRVEIAQLQQARHAKQQNSQSRHQVKAMANELIQKQAKLDSLSMEGSTLRIQLQSESNRVRSLERELKDVRFELAKERQEGDLEAGASGRGPVKLRSNYRTGAVSLQLGETEINNRTVTSIVRTLNSFGTTMSRVLRRSPVARLMFGGYIFLLHAWVCIVLYHLATEVLESHDL
jgi:chromosome segregation ATPase